MTTKVSRILIIILSVFAIMLIALNVTFAIYSNKNENTGIIQFGEQKLNISISNNQTMDFSTDELQQDVTTTRTLKIENPATSSSCVFRLWVEFKVENEIDKNYLQLNIEDANFTCADDGKIYYNKVLNSNTSIENLELQFKVLVEDLSSYEGKHYSIKLYIDSVQANETAVESSWTDYPASWFENLSF